MIWTPGAQASPLEWKMWGFCRETQVGLVAGRSGQQINEFAKHLASVLCMQSSALGTSQGNRDMCFVVEELTDKLEDKTRPQGNQEGMTAQNTCSLEDKGRGPGSRAATGSWEGTPAWTIRGGQRMEGGASMG